MSKEKEEEEKENISPFLDPEGMEELVVCVRVVGRCKKEGECAFRIQNLCVYVYMV